MEGTQAVHAQRLFRAGFSFVDPDKGGTIHYDVRAPCFQRLFYRNRIGAFDFAVAESKDFIAAGLRQDVYKVGPQLARAADDSDSFHVEGFRKWLPLSRGRHQ
jgi:hypothetical protein